MSSEKLPCDPPPPYKILDPPLSVVTNSDSRLQTSFETTTFTRLRNCEQQLTVTRGGFLPIPHRGSWNGPNTKDYTTRDKYEEQGSDEPGPYTGF